MMDILDRLQEEECEVVLMLSCGKEITGRAHSIVWEEDENGLDTVKAILFKPRGAALYDVFFEDDIRSYRKA